MVKEAYCYLLDYMDLQERKVLVHGRRGIDRPCFVVAYFLIRRYGWTMKEAIQFYKLNSLFTLHDI